MCCTFRIILKSQSGLRPFQILRTVAYIIYYLLAHSTGIDLSLYHLTAISVNEAESKLNEMISAFNKKEPFDKLLINMLG